MIEVDRFRRVECPDSTRRWLLNDEVHCNIVEDKDGSFHWAAWRDDNEGTIMSGRAPSANKAEYLAKIAAVRLLSESMSERAQLEEALVSMAGPDVVSLRSSGGSR